MWDSSLFRSLSLFSMKNIEISNFTFFYFRFEIQCIIMRFHEISWRNIEFSKFTGLTDQYRIFKVNFFPVQMWDSILIRALPLFSMKKNRNFKLHWFPRSDVRFDALSCAFMRFHEKISNFQSSLVWQIRSEIKCIIMRFQKISNFESSLFFCSDRRCNAFHAISCVFLKKYWTFKALVSQIRCEIQYIIMRFHEISWKNIELLKFTGFPVQKWDSIHYHALSSVLMKKYRNFTFFPVRFKSFRALSLGSMKTFELSKFIFFPSLDVRFSLFRALSLVSMKNIEFSKFIGFQVEMWDSSLFHALS